MASPFSIFSFRKLFGQSMRPITKQNRRLPLEVELLECRAVPALFVADSLTDNFDGDFSVGQQSLREAISRANSNPGTDTIQLIAGVYNLSITGTGEDGNLTGDLDLLSTNLLTI